MDEDRIEIEEMDYFEYNEDEMADTTWQFQPDIDDD
jgi:hypothetical protein